MHWDCLFNQIIDKFEENLNLQKTISATDIQAAIKCANIIISEIETIIRKILLTSRIAVDTDIRPYQKNLTVELQLYFADQLAEHISCENLPILFPDEAVRAIFKEQFMDVIIPLRKLFTSLSKPVAIPPLPELKMTAEEGMQLFTNLQINLTQSFNTSA